MVSPRNIAKRTTTRARKFQLSSEPKVVGAVHTAAGLLLAEQLSATEVDVLEIRVDALTGHLDKIERVLPQLKIPLLLTVRHPAEGGIGNLALSQRRELFTRFLPYATMVDVELRSAEALGDVIRQVKKNGTALLLSDHYFLRMPSLPQLLTRQRQAFRAGADIFKLAALLKTPREFARILDFAARPAPGLRALMGMGAFGQVSRLALAQAGSVLNYGYLERPNAPGQWEARELKTLLTRIASDGSPAVKRGKSNLSR